MHEATDQTIETWRQVFDRHPTLGYDYFHVQVKGWRPSDLPKEGLVDSIVIRPSRLAQ